MRSNPVYNSAGFFNLDEKSVYHSCIKIFIEISLPNQEGTFRHLKSLENLMQLCRRGLAPLYDSGDARNVL